jgi:hypothetical protein
MAMKVALEFIQLKKCLISSDAVSIVLRRARSSCKLSSLSHVPAKSMQDGGVGLSLAGAGSAYSGPWIRRPLMQRNEWLEGRLTCRTEIATCFLLGFTLWQAQTTGPSSVVCEAGGVE